MRFLIPLLFLLMMIPPAGATEIGVRDGEKYSFQFKLLDLEGKDFDIVFPFYTGSPTSMPGTYDFTMEIIDTTVLEGTETTFCDAITVRFDPGGDDVPYCLDLWQEFLIVDTNWTKWIWHHEEEAQYFTDEDEIHDITNLQGEINIFSKDISEAVLADEGTMETMGYWETSITQNYEKATGVLNAYYFTQSYTSTSEKDWLDEYLIGFSIKRTEVFLSSLPLSPHFFLFLGVLVLTRRRLYSST